MNPEEAKIPDDEGDWQSIEIFLFSNGQYSPPRKYYLRADELDLWDHTLNQLAQSHYGPQSPLIDLYTIDGRLVEGPLELKDGQAYVAVAVRDTYIDAGYQKYLIRASRSWEKRQGKRNIPECVPEEPCCLCPDKEQCCDPETCCLCPEREDADREPILLSDTGHQSLRPAGGHFMSSAPAKPVEADHFVPRSDTIGSTTGEHDVGPGGYETSSRDFGYSPVIAPTAPDENEARLNEYGSNPIEHAPKMSENGSRLSRNGAKPITYDENEDREHRNSENEVKPAEYTARLNENGPRLSKDRARLSQYDSAPGKKLARPGEYEAKPSGQGLRPDECGARLSENGARLGEYKANSGESAGKLSAKGRRPSENGPRPGENRPRLNSNGARPVIYAARNRDNEASPAEYTATLNENGLQLNKNEDRLSQYDVAPDDNLARSDEFKPSPGKHAAILNENRSRPGENGPRLSKNGSRPVDYRARNTQNGAIPAEYTSRFNEKRPIFNTNADKGSELDSAPDENCISNENEVRPAQHIAKLNENRPRLNKNGEKLSEYHTTPDGHFASPGEYEAKPSGQGLRPGENAARLSENRSRSNHNGVRPVKYETKNSENGARPGECIAIINENRLPLVKNGDKHSEHDAAPNKNLTRPGEYQARPSDQGARLGEYEATRLSENEPRLSQNGARLVEYNATPGVNMTRWSEKGAKLGEFGARPGQNTTSSTCEYDVIPSEKRSRQEEYETKPSNNGAKVSEYRARPGEDETRSSVNGTKPEEYADRFAEQTTKPDEYRPIPRKFDERSCEEVAKASRGLSEINSKREAYKNGLRGNEGTLEDSENRRDENIVEIRNQFQKQNSKLGLISENELDKKLEYGTKDGNQRDKEIDPKNRASGMGAKGVEHRVCCGEKSGRESNTVTGVDEPKAIKQHRGELEHTRRISGQRGVEVELEDRAGQPTREFEHSEKVSIQKGREMNPVVRASGRKFGENGARLSDQRKKQNDYSRLGRESKVGDHEARAGDLGSKTNDYDARLGHPSSKIAEPGARAAAFGSKASPRDRITSRARTSNLSQPKMGTPAIRVDETAARSDESEIKNGVGYSGARQSNIGGAGSAGASHLSEAQQHARRSSLSAGRQPTDKKRLSIGQNASLQRKPTRKLEEKQPTKTNKNILPKEMNERANAIPLPTSNDTEITKILPKAPSKAIDEPALPPLTQESLATNKALLENVIVNKEIIVFSTHSFRDPESEIRSVRLDTVKQVVDAIKYSTEETQTEIINIEKSMTSVSVKEGRQTNTETVEQHSQEVSATNEVKVYPCNCPLCCQQNYRHATVNPEENNISISNKGEVINLKLNIEVRNIVRSVNSCPKNCPRTQSLTNIMRLEKESQISFDDDVCVQRSSLQSLLNNQYFQGYGFEGSPRVMVVQCAGCGRLNNPLQQHTPPCCDNNKKYYVLLTNSVDEDIDEICNFNPPCRPCDLRQSKKQSCCVPIKQALSEMALDTITTVTVSGVPLQKREREKCMIDASCQTEESQTECMATKRKVSITQEVSTCNEQKKSNSSIFVTTQADNLMTNHSCLKICQQKCAQEDSQVCIKFSKPVYPATWQKLQSVCSQISLQTCTQESSQSGPRESSKSCPQESSKSCPQESSKSCPQESSKSCPQESSQTYPQESSKSCPQESSKSCPQESSQTYPQESSKSCPQESSQTCPQESSKSCPQESSQTCPQESLKSCPQESSQTCPQVKLEKYPQVNLQTCPQESSQTCPQESSKSYPQESSKSCPQESSQTCPKGNLQTCPLVNTQTCPQVVLQTFPQESTQTCPQESSQTCPQESSQTRPQESSQTCPQGSLQTCPQEISQTSPQVQAKGCQQTCLQVQSPTCPARCSVPQPCIQIQTQVCQQVPHVSNTHTQTRWSRIILQAQQHCDGRYSLHLPPLFVLNNYSL